MWSEGPPGQQRHPPLGESKGSDPLPGAKGTGRPGSSLRSATDTPRGGEDSGAGLTCESRHQMCTEPKSKIPVPQLQASRDFRLPALCEWLYFVSNPIINICIEFY